MPETNGLHYGAIPLANGYWQGAVCLPGGQTESAMTFHDESEALEWGRQQARLYATAFAPTEGDDG